MLAMTGEESQLIGYDRRKMRFPLRALTLTQADSTMHPQLQVADLCAGISNHFHRCWMADNFDELATATRDLGRVGWTVDGVVPSPDVTPEALGTNEGESTNAVNAIAEHLWRRQQS